MPSNKIIIVLLRQPQNRPNESRTDPFWEFGSFGLTRCHRTNLMHPAKLEELEGVRLTFAQGGNGETRLVYLTPAITEVRHYNWDGSEVIWPMDRMPFQFKHAPLIVDKFNKNHTDFPLLRGYIEKTKQESPVAKFASRFRSRRLCLEEPIAQEMLKVWEQKIESAPVSAFAQTYLDALPYSPRCPDTNRENTYRILQKNGPQKPTCRGFT